jgi:hypothetical protein
MAFRSAKILSREVTRPIRVSISATSIVLEAGYKVEFAPTPSPGNKPDNSEAISVTQFHALSNSSLTPPRFSEPTPIVPEIITWLLPTEIWGFFNVQT